MKQVRFDKHCKPLAKYITLNKWYDVLSEWKLAYKIRDDSGYMDSYPKTWVVEERKSSDSKCKNQCIGV